MIKLLLLTLTTLCLSQEISSLISQHTELEKKLHEIEDILHKVNELTSETYLKSLNIQVNKLKDDMLRTDQSLSVLEKTTEEMTKGHKEFNKTYANEMMLSLGKLEERIEKVDNRIKTLDFQKIIEKIEIGLNGLATQDNQVKNSILKVKEQTEYLEVILARESNFIWVYILMGFISLISILSWFLIHKAEEKEI
ncbi:unnamed protein product [Blepharisma stoltei]|uniref:Uncharacterized protein n=1 Tax=Blepharisma stoltei TaxID=1481888 RepID=A0AAU9II56_9CILI|nr:unnamed protein product [Blepharisma stoltei]